MKKLFIFITICVVLLGGFIYWGKTKKPTEQKPPTTKVSTNRTSGISFTYPQILTVTQKDDQTTVHHEIPFVHHDYCDFKGESTTTIPTLTDFNLNMYTRNENYVTVMKTESPYIPQENFVNSEVVPSPGFIDTITVGTLSGFKIFEGAEGCGQTTYYFPITNKKTLVVKQQFITIFSGAIDVDQGVEALKVPGVISKEKESEILKDILESLSVN